MPSPRSNHQIRVTHVGSLPRPQGLVEQVFAEDRGEEVDREAYERAIAEAVDECVAKQVGSGVDIVSDGEMSKIGYATYIRHRLSGFELGEVPRATPADLDAYPEVRDRLASEGTTAKYQRPICRAPIAYENREPLERDLRNLRAAVDRHLAAEGFMNAPSPGVVALFQPNEHYPSLEGYLAALTEALRVEYEAITAAGFYVQIDAPDLAMGRHIMYKDRPDEEFVGQAEVHIEVLNEALRNVPAERARLHICWGNYPGPHHLDIPVRKIADVVLRAKPATLLVEAANPRHGQDWAAWAEAKIPDDKIFAPGVVDTTTNYIEHPELIAGRLTQYANIVGTERVAAGTDCGFGTWAGFGAVEPAICWAKFEAMAEGARLASR